MRSVLKILSRFSLLTKKMDAFGVKERNFFDYSSKEKIKIMRAAGQEAQREQFRLLKAYEAQFGRV